MAIIGFCNPLLDITLSSSDSKIKTLLKKYGLKDNDIILADPIKHSGLIDEMISVSEGKIRYTAGGAGLNTLRCSQVALNFSSIDEISCKIVGSIGNDRFGEILQEKSKEAGIEASFQKTSPKPSGRCACLIHGHERSLVAFLGAANDFCPDHLDSLKDEIGKARFLYITGFFYSVSPASLKRIFEIAGNAPARIIFNLSATFVCDGMSESDFKDIMQNVNILIGNSDELFHLNARQKIYQDNSIEQIALKLTKSFPEVLIIITQGSEPVLLFQNGASLLRFSVPVLPAELIVDTNGAGDAFVGGLLAGFERSLSLKKSLELAAFMAAKVIQCSGCEPPLRSEIEEFLIKQ